jgi:hypothetical protein
LPALPMDLPFNDALPSQVCLPSPRADIVPSTPPVPPPRLSLV